LYHEVSNPWREAIEAIYLGRSHTHNFVSNPWREAIEVMVVKKEYCDVNVSNPWREAIEGRKGVNTSRGRYCFQSLEGGY